VKMYKIEVDEEVYNFLKKKADPFVDINPNSVLRRLLLNNSKTNKSDKPNVLPEFSASVPHALAETLEMIILVKKEGFNRIEATHKVADIRRISTQAVLDKYCRQLNKRAYEVDELLTTANLDKFKTLLIVKYPYHKATIERIFSDISA
jgi:negative regulator of replication initiation